MSEWARERKKERYRIIYLYTSDLYKDIPTHMGSDYYWNDITQQGCLLF